MEEVSKRIVAFVDLGTNSTRLLIVRLDTHFAYRVLRQQKIMIRLGEGEFVSGYLTDEAMDRAIVSCRGFYETAVSFGAKEIIGFATSATRDAKNREIFLERLSKESGIDFETISGSEEARLIWLGITNSMTIKESPVLFIDIGGGSTELIVGDQYSYSFLHSLRLGSLRSTTQFFSNPEKPIPENELKTFRKHLIREVGSIAHEIKKYAPIKGIGSSGTVIALENLARKIVAGHQTGILTRKEVKSLDQLLAGLSHDERCALPGIQKERADIIVAGSQILYEVMKACSIREIRTTEFGLRYGMLIDHLSRSPGFLPKGNLSVRDASIYRLSQMFGVEQEHADHVSWIVAQMFDSGRAAGLFLYDDRWRELLLYAAHVHDIGQFISLSRHQLHSAYIVSNAEIVGFSEYEILIISLFCRYHRKKFPRDKDAEYDTLSPEDKRAVLILSFILRWAEVLDRSHDGRVNTAVLSRAGDHKILLTLTAVNNCILEMWAVEEEIPLFKTVFGYDVTIVCTRE